MMEKIISYKGFKQDMTCRDFQYKEGESYEEPSAKACEREFYAYEYPLDCLDYYSPNESVYHVVEQSGEISRHSDDTKVTSTKIKIGAEINIAGLVKAAIEYTMKRVNPEAKADERQGASSATGNCGASSATGYKGASSATGYKGASSATGYCGASSATGYYGASLATGDCGASSATGYKGASSATGDYGASSATGYKGASSAGDSESVAVAWGYHGKAKGVLGAHLVLADWEGDEDDYWNQDSWQLKGAKMVRVDGEIIKPDTYYTMKNGEVVEAEE